MARIVAAFTGGIALGVILMFAADRFGQPDDQMRGAVVRDITDVPKMEQAAAEQHRIEQ